MPRGGPRPNSGRKPKPEGQDKARSFRCSDSEWQAIKDRAKQAGLTTTEYLIKKALQD